MLSQIVSSLEEMPDRAEESIRANSVRPYNIIPLSAKADIPLFKGDKVRYNLPPLKREVDAPFAPTDSFHPLPNATHTQNKNCKTILDESSGIWYDKDGKKRQEGTSL